METIIKVHPSELNDKLLDKIRQFIGKKKYRCHYFFEGIR